MERPADFTIFSDFLCFERKGENTLDKTARSKIARKLTHRGFAPINRPEGARRFSIFSLPTANYCDWTLGFFDSL